MNSRLIYHDGSWVCIDLCDNALFRNSNFGNGIGIWPQCLDGLAEVKVEVRYNGFEKGVCCLCKECYQALVRKASVFDYKVTGEPIL